MVRLLFAFDHHVIDLNIYSFTHDWFENLGDHSLIYDYGFFQPEEHDFVVEYTAGIDEGSFLLIGLMHCYLLITSVCIQEANPSMTRGRIY